MDMKRFDLKIFRFDPTKDSAPSYKEYEIRSASSMSVLMALEHIYEHMDETLAFRRYCCGTSRCNSCLMQSNGKKIRACSTLVEEGRTTVVEPLGGYRVIKDLVINFDEKEGSTGGDEEEDA